MTAASDYLITETPEADDNTAGMITLCQLETLDREEWSSVEINNPISNEVIDHLINRFLRDEA